MTLPEALLLGLWCHFLGDYLFQSDWMAVEKTKKWLPAAVHAVTYTLPFLVATRNPVALVVIGGTHFVIDRWRLARFVVWAKNFHGAAPVVAVVGGVLRYGLSAGASSVAHHLADDHRRQHHPRHDQLTGAVVGVGRCGMTHSQWCHLGDVANNAKEWAITAIGVVAAIAIGSAGGVACFFFFLDLAGKALS